MTPPRDPDSNKKRLTPTYLLVYLLCNEDTWRCAIGIAAAVVLAPVLQPLDRTGLGRYVMFITVVVVGWALSKAPSRWIVARMRRIFPNG